MKRNRWLIALAAAGIHICIGSVYAWSVLTKPVMAGMGLSLSETTWAFSIAILFLGLSAGFLGGIVERLGPRKSGLVSACFFASAMVGTAFAVYVKSAVLLYLFYGCIGGIGLGTGYITPVSTLVKWFPLHRGFATGLAIMGFGFAALIAGPAMQYLTVTVGLAENFLILAAVYAAVMALSLFIGVYGSVDGEMKEEAERYTIAAEELPEAFDGLKVAQITDTHIGPYYRNADLANDLERSKAEGADVVMLTGDLIDDIRVMPETAKILNSRAVLFPYGIIYVRGNHELYKDPDYIENELRKTSVKILDNSHVALQKDGALLYVAGVDYPEMRGEGRAELMAQMVRDAFDGIPEDSAKIFLAHHSDFIDAGFENRAFLTLTGHTHGTQFGIFGKPMITPFKYTRGMYSDGKHCGYVSRGSGGWFPFRFDTGRELTIFTLKKK